MALRPRKGMMSGPSMALPPSDTKTTAMPGMMYAGGTPNFDERTGQPIGTTKGGPTKQAPIRQEEPAPASEPKTEMTFTFVEGKERGGAAQDYLYGQEGEVQQLTVDELRDYFESDKVNRLPEVFGTFDNYLAYMTEREQLIQSGDYDVGNWSEADAGFTEDQEMILEGDADLTIDPSDPGQNLENLRRQQTSTQQGAYNNWINSEANQALLQKYGVNPVVYSNSGDKFQWNGSAYVKTVNEDHAGLADFVKMGITTAIGIMSGGALAPALGGIGSAVVSNALTQAITTGSIDPEQLLQTAATAGLGQAVSQIIGPEIESALGGIDLSEITGIEEVDNVLNAMGQTAIRQAVFDGELDMDQIISSGLFAGAQELANFILEPIQQFIAENTTASPEAMEELARRQAELRDGLNQEAFEEITSNMNDTLNTAIAEQQNAAIANQLRDLSGNLQSIYEEAYAVSPQPSGPSVEDFMANSVDDADSELADTTADLITDTTAETEPMRSLMYADDTIVPADRVEEILDGSTVVTTLDGSGDYEYGPMEVGDTYLAYHTQHTDDSGIEYTLIRGSNGRLYVSDGTNLVEYQGASDLTHNGAQISWLDSHLVSGGQLPAGTNNSRFIAYMQAGDGSSLSNRIADEAIQNMEAGWQDVNNPTLESSMAQETPDTPLDLEVEVDPFEYEEEPELIPEPPPEPEPEIEPVEQQEQEQTPGEDGTASPSPDPTQQLDPSFAPAPTPAPEPEPERTPQEEAPITTGMFEEYFPEPAPASASDSALLSGASPADASASASSASTAASSASGTATGTTPESSAPATTGVGAGSGAGVPAGEAYEQGSMIGDARALIEQALLNGATPEYLQENFPQYSDIITEVSSQLGTVPTQQPSVTAEDVEGIVSRAVEAIPEGMTPEQVSGVVNEAIGNIEFPEGMTASEVSGIVDNAIANIQFPEGLSAEDVNNIVENAIFGIDFPESATIEDVNQAITEAGFATSEDVEAGQAAATEERRNLQQAIIGAQGDIERLDESTRQQFEEFGGTVNELFSDVNVDIEALQAGQISQAEAQQAFQQSTEEQFGELGGQIGELGTQLGGLASDVSGIGRGLEGLGEGVAGLGEGLGAGLLGLAAQQAILPAQFAAVQPIDPVDFEDFYRRLTRRKIADPLRIGMFTGGARSVG